MGKNPSTRVFVVRSGQTEWDHIGRLQGSTDVPLCKQTLPELQACINELAGTRIGSIHCGPDEASVESADLLAKTTDGTVTVVNDLAEMNLGLWEGMLLAEMTTRFPRACKAWMEDPSLINPPGGETLIEARERITGAACRILDRARSGSSIALVLRPIALGMVRCWLGDEPTCNIWCEAHESQWGRWFDVQPRVLSRPASVR